MSTGRRTAFARTPRNPGANSSKKEESITRINKGFLDRLTQARLEPETATILTKSNGELALTIGANGKGNYAVTQRDGSVIADAADVMKIQTLGSFINEERKAVLKSSVSGSTQKALAAIVLRCMNEDGEFRSFPRTFLDAYRALSAQMDTLAANVTAITALEASPGLNEEVKNHLLSTATKIRQVVGEYVMYRAKLGNDDVPEKINSRLKEGGIMSWVYTRLTAQRMQLGGKDFEFRRVYWPKDPTKGLQVTFGEWNSPEVKDTQMGVLQGCQHSCRLWNWETTRSFLGFADTADLDFEGPHKALHNVPLLVVPPSGGMTPEEIVAALGKSGDRGLSWQVGTTTKPQDTLKFLGTVPRRVYLGLVARPVMKTRILTRIFPGFDPAAEGDGVYAKLQRQFKQGTVTMTWPENACTASGDLNQGYLRSLIRDIMGITHEPLSGVINGITDEARPPRDRAGPAATDVWAEIMAEKAAISDDRAREVLVNRADPTWFSRKKKSKEIDFRSARSQLTPQAIGLIEELKARRYHGLALRIEAWLRTFLTGAIQAPVAEVILARLDASLSRPVEYGRDDRIAVMQPFEGDSDDEPADEGDEDVNPDEE